MPLHAVTCRSTAVQAARTARQAEYQEFVSRLGALRGHCEQYTVQLQTKRRELVSEERELARVAAEVKESQAKAESCLAEAQTISSRLQEARDQVRQGKWGRDAHAPRQCCARHVPTSRASRTYYRRHTPTLRTLWDVTGRDRA